VWIIRKDGPEAYEIFEQLWFPRYVAVGFCKMLVDASYFCGIWSSDRHNCNDYLLSSSLWRPVLRYINTDVLPWAWKQHIPSKRWFLYIKPHDVTSQTAVKFVWLVSSYLLLLIQEIFRRVFVSLIGATFPVHCSSLDSITKHRATKKLSILLHLLICCSWIKTFVSYEPHTKTYLIKHSRDSCFSIWGFIFT
jgi:hypothetical protein